MVIPCDLCTVSAHASLSGVWSLSAYFLPPPCALNSAGPTARTRPLSNATRGTRGNIESAIVARLGWILNELLCRANSVSFLDTNALTTPLDPFTRSSSTFRRSTTCAPTLSVSDAGTGQFFRSASSAPASSPRSCASNVTDSPGSFASSPAFSASTLALTE